MSTLSALANSTATIFSLDVYQQHLRPRATDKEIVSVGRWASFAALAIAALLAPTVSWFGGVFQYFQTGVSYIASPLIAVILCGVFWRRANARGALTGLIVGQILTALLLVLVVLVSFLDKEGSGLSARISGVPWFYGFLQLFHGIHWLYVASAQEAIVILVVVGVSLATAPPPRESVEPFLWRPSFLTENTKESSHPWYAGLTLWFSIFAIVWLYLYWRFW
jgi:SSS family solute:Na+ symporter